MRGAKMRRRGPVRMIGIGMQVRELMTPLQKGVDKIGKSLI